MTSQSASTGTDYLEGTNVPKKYRKKTEEIEAILLTDDNQKEVAAFCGKAFRMDRGGSIFIGDFQSYHRVEIGMYVVKSLDTNTFHALTPNTIERKYEEIT